MNLCRQRRASGRAGFSLLELSISMLLLVMLMGSVGVVGQTNMKSFQLTGRLRGADVTAQRAIQRIATELKLTGVSRLAPDPALNAFDFESQVDFDQVIDIVNGAPVWGPLLSIGFEYEVGEVDDGLDNDGDGLVDEGRVVMTRNLGVGPTRIVLCKGVSELLEGEGPNGIDDNGNGLVDEAGFCIERNGDVLDIRLTILSTDPDNRTFARTVETSVRLRN